MLSYPIWMNKTEFVRRLNNPVPEIGDTFKLSREAQWPTRDHSWRVTGYIKLVEPEAHKSNEASKYDEIGAMLNNILIDSAQKQDGKLMMWCAKEEATHVTGTGVAGCIEKISDIEVTGRVSWSEDMIQNAVRQHERMIGEYVD